MELIKFVVNKELSLVSQLKRDIIKDVVNGYCNLPLTEETGKRVTCIRIEGKPFYEKYILDANTENEKLILEFDLVSFNTNNLVQRGIPGFHITILKDARKFIKDESSYNYIR